MKHEQHHGPLEPQDVEELLPWYVTGRVSREEARGIEAALKTMPDLAGKLAQVQREREAVSRASEAVESAPPETLQRLLQQVETTRQWRVPKIESHSEAGGWLKAAMGRNAVWQTALAVACVAIVALGVQVYNPPRPTKLWSRQQYQRRRRRKLWWSRSSQARRQAISASLLTGLGAKIVDGPKPGGAYMVKLPSDQASDVDAATASLLARKDLVAGVMAGQ